MFVSAWVSNSDGEGEEVRRVWKKWFVSEEDV